MSFRTSMIAASLIAGVAVLAPSAQGGGLTLVSGALYGDVHNNAGVPQIGADVFLYNRLDQMVRQTLTSEGGRFVFDSLPAGVYSIRVSMASFFPARRSNIAISPGSENLLHVNLGSLFSAVDIAPPSAVPGALMSDEWKWVLRTSAATRPVLRLRPVPSSSGHRRLAANFTEVTGLVKLSAGDSGPVAGSGAQDFGTAFAVATRLNGVSQVRLSGDLGYIANTGLPTAAFRTTYSRDQDDGQPGPQMTLTMHQIYFPGLGPGANPAGGYPSAASDAGPALRTVSLGMLDRLQINDELGLEYGANVDSISFIQHETRMSPFARATYSLGDSGALILAFSSGTPASQILTRDGSGAAAETGNQDLSQDLAALAMLPAISRDNGRSLLETQRNLEAGYQLVRGQRKYYLGVYGQSVSDAAFNMSAPPVFSSRADLLPALDGNYYVFDLGNYQRTGFVAAVTQSLGDHANFTVSTGRTGDLVVDSAQASGATAADVRNGIRSAQRVFVVARASAVVPGVGLRVAASYGWTGDGALMPTYYSLSSPVNQEQGLNIAVRQPLPHFIGFKGRLEATAELLNALADGYLPVTAAGHCSVLTDAPRALRGGLSFVF